MFHLDIVEEISKYFNIYDIGKYGLLLINRHFYNSLVHNTNDNPIIKISNNSFIIYSNQLYYKYSNKILYPNNKYQIFHIYTNSIYIKKNHKFKKFKYQDGLNDYIKIYQKKYINNQPTVSKLKILNNYKLIIPNLVLNQTNTKYYLSKNNISINI